MKEASVEQKDLVTVQPLPIQPAAPTPMSILARAVELGRPIDELAKLMDLQERWERNEAKKAFDAALAAFKENPPEIVKNRSVDYDTKAGGKVHYKHATLDRVTAAIGKALAKHGLSATWSTAQPEKGRIVVTCKLKHKLGHEECTTLEGPPDDSGFKSPVQQIASTISFLERYTLLAATGMATRDDADGITFGDAEDMLASIESAANLDELQDRFNKAYKRGFAAKDKAAMGIAVEAKDRRKAELTGAKVPKSQVSTEDPAGKAKFEEFEALCEKKGLNQANRHMLLAKHENTDAAIAELKSLPDPSDVGQGDPGTAGDSGKTPAHETKADPAKKGRGKKNDAQEAHAGKPVAPASVPPPKEPEWGF